MGGRGSSSRSSGGGGGAGSVASANPNLVKIGDKMLDTSEPGVMNYGGKEWYFRFTANRFGASWVDNAEIVDKLPAGKATLFGRYAGEKGHDIAVYSVRRPKSSPWAPEDDTWYAVLE